jgi:hypothetical protein
MSAATTSDENLLKSVGNKITTQLDRAHQFEMEIRKHTMLTKGIKTQQRFLG